ncbi:MAG: NAD(P)/FAD-dependent oxidoreductase [Porticoccaceae bacterium]|nr:NAD(P)/FAD-dependent oxidoreductase [Porticoccaceae bacterium]
MGNEQDISNNFSETNDHRIIIVGTGFSGVGAAIKLKQQGIHSFIILERAGEIGGTWRDNTYPGAACDVQSHLYSFSFEKNPNWSRTFSPQQEIQDYMLHCVEKYQLRKHIRLNTPINRATFAENTGRWTLQSAHGEHFTAQVLVTACGALSNPALPSIKGIDTFAGKIMHTAQWDHDYPLENKRIGVIGTGASAIQVVPAIAPLIKNLTVFQRTAPWVVPKADKPYRQGTKNMLGRVPFIQKLYRGYIYLLNEVRAPLIIFDTFLSKLLEKEGLRNINHYISDPILKKKVTPEFKVGCKRILLTNDWYSTLSKSNVDLVTDPILEINKSGVVTKEGTEYPFDVIIAATGFDVPTAAAPFEIIGLNGASLNEQWRDGAEAHRGTTVSGFPNLFIMMGPNTGSGSTSMVYYIESQIHYILQGIQLILDKNLKYVDVIQECQDTFNARIERKMKKMVWSSGCKSWYQASNGKITTLWPGFSWQFRLATRRFDQKEYHKVMGQR